MAEREVEELRRRVAELEAEIAESRRSDQERAERTAHQLVALLAELQHRVKNILAVVQAVVKRTTQTSTGREVEEFAAHLSGRIDALTRVHGALFGARPRAISLEEMLRVEILSQGGIADEQVKVEGPAVLLRDKAAEVLSLALHELATNAVKFGALSNDRGVVTVSWRLKAGEDGGDTPTERLHLEWTETGGDHDGRAPDYEGFGLTWIRHGLTYALDAATVWEVRPGGLHCVLDLPLGIVKDDGDRGELI